MTETHFRRSSHASPNIREGGSKLTWLHSTRRFFFVVMAVLFLVMAIFGFVPSYQKLAGRLFPLHWFAHVHGVLMAGWLLVFLVQALLASFGRIAYHRQLGQYSVIHGVLIWISMITISFLTLLADNPPVGHFLFDVLIIQSYGMLMFGLFFTWGILARKNAAIHKRLLFLATLVLIQAAIDRMHWLPFLHNGLAIRFYYLDAFVVLLFLYDLAGEKRIHRISVIGALLLLISQFTVVQVWGSRAWHSFWFDLLNGFR